MTSLVPSFPAISKRRESTQSNLLATTALALFWSAGLALAQTAQGGATQTSVAADTTLTFDIPAQPLAQALSVFSRQSGLQISQPAGITGTATSTALVGRFTAAQGLERLLRGSNISFRIGDNAAILSGPAASGGAPLSGSGATVLDTISVTGGGSIGQAQRDVYTGDKSTVVITPEAMDRFGRVTAGDLLKGQAGVQVGDNRNGGGLDVNIRGVQGQSSVAVTVDGTQQALDTYRGYAGTQQRSYIDPDLIGGVVINKGPSLAPNASGAIGGTVAMQTIGVDDIVKEGQSFGIRLKGELWGNGIEPQGPRSGVPRWEKYQATARNERGNLFDSEAKSGSVAGAYTSEHLDIVAAYARRNQGNYFAGKHGRDQYRIYTPQRRWDGTTYFYEENSVAKVYKEGEEVMNTSSDTESALLKATIRPNEEHTLDLGYRYFDGRFGEIMPSVIFRSSSGNRLGQWPVGSMEINSFNARYAYDPADNDLINLKANAWLTDANSEQLNGGPLTPTSQESDFDGDYGWARQHNQRFGIDVANRSEFDTALGGVKLDVSAAYLKEFIEPAKGVVITQDDLNNNRYLRDGERQEGNVAGQVTIEPTDDLSFRLGGRYMDFRSQDNNRASTPVYESKTFRNIVLKRGSSWLANARWFPDADGNYTDATNPLKNNGTATSYDDYSEVKISDLNYDGTTVYAPQTSQLVTGYKFGDKLVRKDGGFAPAFGATYNLDENSLIYVNYSEGLRMPGLFESTLGTLQVRQVASLKPEHSRNWEIGASTLTSDVLTGGDSLGLKLAYFNTNIEDYITRYYNPAGSGMMVLRNADSFKVSGLELQANYDEGRFFADASATYYFSAQTCDRDVAAQLRATADEYTDTGNTPDCTAGGFSGSYSNTQNPPKYSVNLTAGMRFFEETLTIGGRITHTSGPIDKLEKPWQKNVTAAQVFYRPVTVVDAFASYKLRDDAVLNVSVENLTNRYYLDPLAQSFMPAPGRTFRASLAMKF